MSFFSGLYDRASNAFTSVLPQNCCKVGQDGWECFEVKLSKDHMRILCCALVTIIVLGIIFGELGKTTGILAGSLFVACVCNRLCKRYFEADPAPAPPPPPVAVAPPPPSASASPIPAKK